MYLARAGYLHYIKTASNHTTGTGAQQEISSLGHAWLGMQDDTQDERVKKPLSLNRCVMQHPTRVHASTYTCF